MLKKMELTLKDKKLSKKKFDRLVIAGGDGSVCFAVNEMLKLSGLNDKLVGYILDLRNNPGGLLTQAIKISDFFLEDGEIRVFNDGGEVFLKPGDGTRMGAKTKAPTPAKPWSVENIEWIRGATQLPQ